VVICKHRSIINSSIVSFEADRGLYPDPLFLLIVFGGNVDNSTVVAVRLDPQSKEVLDQLAFRSNRSRGGYIRFLLHAAAKVIEENQSRSGKEMANSEVQDARSTI
jgi:hypothetical protein